MNDANNGSKLYLYSITTVAILGGLLFGYDTIFFRRAVMTVFFIRLQVF